MEHKIKRGYKKPFFLAVGKLLLNRDLRENISNLHRGASLQAAENECFPSIMCVFLMGNQTMGHKLPQERFMQHSLCQRQFWHLFRVPLVKIKCVPHIGNREFAQMLRNAISGKIKMVFISGCSVPINPFFFFFLFDIHK